jgi:hypothetical protein
MAFYELLLLPENLIWAWRKARRLYRQADALFDQSEVAAFDLNLERELDAIHEQFKRGRYKLSPLKLLPQPKRPDANGRPRMRQSFQVAVRDQVAWIAVINALGPKLDARMPMWSYGHRLFRPAWYDDDQIESHLNIGPYRHAQGYLFRKFQHSWPLFRRHVTLTARRMVTEDIDIDELDEGDRRALRYASDPPNSAERLKYLEDGYWVGARPSSTKLYYASLDLTKFYPSIAPYTILAGLREVLPGLSDEPPLQSIIAGMLNFEVTTSGLSEALLASVDPQTATGKFPGIPTGLMVAGFLANIAMLPVDIAADWETSNIRRIAHFRFVDDHSFLAFDFDELCKWIVRYKALLSEKSTGLTVNQDKFSPARLHEVISDIELDTRDTGSAILREEASRECEIDGRKPSKLMTSTLAQVSILAGADFETLTDAARHQRLEQLEWLLLASMPDTEIRADTRMAFAAGRIATLAPTIMDANADAVELRRAWLRELRGAEPDDLKIAEIAAALVEKSNARKHSWTRHCAYYFSLLFRAFSEHPDKVRLVTRLIDFCRATGFDGLGQLAGWMRGNESSKNTLLKRYLGALTLHCVSRLLPSAAEDAYDRALLHRQRSAGMGFVDDLLVVDVTAFADQRGILSALPEYFQLDALRAFAVAVRAASVTCSVNGDATRAMKLAALANKFITSTFESPSHQWSAETKFPIGVWVHWAETLAGDIDGPSHIWKISRSFHDPYNQSDWNDLRKHPGVLPQKAWSRIADDARLLRADDAGWLFDAMPSSHQSGGQPLKSRVSKLVRSVRDKRLETSVSMVEWLKFISALGSRDPRAGEWTAIEILRHLLRPALTFGKSVDDLSRLHPYNIYMPRAWMESPKEEAFEYWTWEAWKRFAQSHPAKVQRPYIRDYRYEYTHASLQTKWSQHLGRLGRIFWCLLRKSCALPNIWNVRGQERALADLFSKEVEALSISSTTFAILEACLVPRNRETLLILKFPTLFGTVEAAEPNDITLDPPPITSPNAFEDALHRSQQILEQRQITVLQHLPRQLVPVHIGQIAKSGFSIGEDEIDENE